MRSRSVLHVSLLLAACSLAACGARTDVSATSNVPALYSHVWVTVEDVKFNTSSTAAPGDSSWLDFPLSTPTTIDLATVTNGGLAIFGSALKIPTGTYAQMQLLLSDSSAALVTSAQTAGLLYNDQVEYLNSAGAAVAAPLELVHPDNGIVLAVTLTIPNNTKAFAESLDTTSTATTGTDSTTGLATTTPTTTAATTTCDTTTTDTTTTTPVTTTSNTCSSPTLSTFAVGIDFDAEHDLVPFTFSAQPGFLLNPHLAAYDLSIAGTIQGEVDISLLTTTTTTATTTTPATASGNPDIEVSAETLSSDGTRHVVVKSTPLLSDGSFVLYPLTTNATSADATTTTTYDLVIHGPLINTVIIKSVPASVAAPASATTVGLTGVQLTSVADYAVNIATATPFTTAGALVQFYQTVPVSGEVPYVVAQQPIDPFNNVFAGNAALSAGPIAVSTYSGGVTSTPVSEAPTEGTGTYQVSAIAPNFTDGAFGTKVSAPNPITATAVLVKLAPLSVATGSASTTLSVKTAVAAPGKYNKGELILSQNGAIVAVTSLDSILDESSGTVTVERVPGGTSSQSLTSGLYDLSAWVWNSSNPTGTLSRQSNTAAVDLRTGTGSGASLTVD